MNEPVDSIDLELQELHTAVADVQSVLAESWFHEMAVCEVSDYLDRLSILLEEAGLGG